jgi:hypothetical protein
MNPGNYVVRTWIGSSRLLMQKLGPSLMSGELLPDVSVKGGQEQKWNMTLVRPQIGTVSGNVLKNGDNATGFRVELKKQEDAGAQPETNGGGFGGFGGRGGRNFFSRSLSATVSATGEFKIKDVPAGLYELSISSSRGQPALLTEVIQVFAGGDLNRMFAVQTASLKGTLTTADATDMATIGGSVSLVPNQTVAPTEELRTWLRENGAVTSRIRSGAFEFATIRPGSYLIVLQPRNRTMTTQQVVVTSEETVMSQPARSIQLRLTRTVGMVRKERLAAVAETGPAVAVAQPAVAVARVAVAVARAAVAVARAAVAVARAAAAEAAAR